MDSPTTRPPLPDPQTFQIIGAAIEVHRQTGGGFSEPIYGEAFAIELGIRKIPFKREVRLPIEYKGRTLEAHFRADFVCFESVLVEIKALAGIGSIEHGQVLNYLRASKMQRALLLNFGPERLQHQRIVLDLKDDPVPR